jgi:hypothetical protein
MKSLASDPLLCFLNYVILPKKKRKEEKTVSWFVCGIT